MHGVVVEGEMPLEGVMIKTAKRLHASHLRHLTPILCPIDDRGAVVPAEQLSQPKKSEVTAPLSDAVNQCGTAGKRAFPTSQLARIRALPGDPQKGLSENIQRF